MRKECATIASHKEAYVPKDSDEGAPVLVSNDNGYTYGAVMEFCLGNADYDG